MRRILGACAAVAALSLVGAQAASAAWQVGDACVGDDFESGWTAIVLNNDYANSPVAPLVPPEGAKVITRWKVEAEPGTPPTSQQLVATLPVAEDEDVLIGESALETVVAGQNEFATRVPVLEYAHVGLRGSPETLFCDKLDTHSGGIVSGPWALDERRQFEYAGIGVPVIAVVEPDRDGDGYGDETQDGCTENAAVHGPCPIFSLRVAKEVKGRTIVIRVTPSSAAQVTVSGQVRWRVAPKRKKGKRRHHARPRRGRLVVVSLGDGGTVSAGPEAEAVFRLRLRGGVLKRLSKMSPKQGLRTLVKVSASDELGQPGGHLFRFKVHRTWR